MVRRMTDPARSRTRPVPAWIAAALVLALASRVAGCGSSTAPVDIAAVRLEPTDVELTLPGDAHQLKAIASDSRGSDVTGIEFAWLSANPDIATVDVAGVVTGLKAGSTHVSAVAGGVSGTSNIVVLAAIAALELRPAKPALTPGHSLQLFATAEDDQGRAITGRQITWSINDQAVATVSPTGLLTAISPGVATISATESRKTATTQVIVLAPIAALSLGPNGITLHPNETLQLHASLTDDQGQVLDGRQILWTARDLRVAEVSADGVVVAHDIGTTFIIAEAESQRDSAALRVQAAVASVGVTPDHPVLAPGETLQLSATPRDGTGAALTGRMITWSSSDPRVAGVSAAGMITAAAEGVASISVTSEGRSGSAVVTVVDRVSSITISPTTRNIVVGETMPFVATVRGVSGLVLSGRTVDWSSTPSGVVTVSATGLVTGQDQGTTMLQASSEGVTQQAIVNVSRPNDEPVVIMAAGDIATCDGDGDEATARLLDALPGTVLTLGDNAYPMGSEADFNDCYAPTWGRHKDRTHPIPGNHEYQMDGGSGYFNYFGAAAGDPATGYYSYDLGAWHIIALNSQFSGKVGTPQAEWVKADLAAHQQLCTMAVWHVPLFGQDSASTRMKNVYQLLYDAGAELVLNGHEHNYQRFAPQTADGVVDPDRGIREFIVGTGGRSIGGGTTAFANREAFNANAFGVLKLSLHATSFDWEFVPVAGKTYTDRGSASCH